MRLSGGGEVRGARRRPAGRRTQSVVMGYDPHALESDAESPALARGRLGESSGDLAGSSWPCVRRELVLGGTRTGVRAQNCRMGAWFYRPYRGSLGLLMAVYEASGSVLEAYPPPGTGRAPTAEYSGF